MIEVGSWQKPHPVTALIWTALASSTVVTSHSGYHLPLVQSPEKHDFHHLKFNTNFGTLGLCDCACLPSVDCSRVLIAIGLHNTNAQFKASPQYKYRGILWSLSSVRERLARDKVA